MPISRTPDPSSAGRISGWSQSNREPGLPWKENSGVPSCWPICAYASDPPVAVWTDASTAAIIGSLILKSSLRSRTLAGNLRCVRGLAPMHRQVTSTNWSGAALGLIRPYSRTKRSGVRRTISPTKSPTNRIVRVCGFWRRRARQGFSRSESHGGGPLTSRSRKRGALACCDCHRRHWLSPLFSCPTPGTLS
jgi:hypothetical protein